MCNQYGDIELKSLLRIRNFELTILDLFAKGLIKGTTHTCLGQEYVPVALKPYVGENDFVISNHRGHGHFITFTGEIEGLLRELMGKKGAVCNGMGGSQHLYYKNIMTTGVQGEGVAVALGVAWSFFYNAKKQVTYVFVGDGTFGRGSVYESLNLACLLKLPYVLIVENNQIAMTTAIADNMAGTIEDRVKSFGADYIKIETQDVMLIRQMLAIKINMVRSGNGPLVVEFVTNRVGAHSKGDDTRREDELSKIKESYWYNRYKQAYPDQLQQVETEVTQEMQLILDKLQAEAE